MGRSLDDVIASLPEARRARVEARTQDLKEDVAREHTLPFDVRPNPETMAAMEEARRSSLPSFTTVSDLMADLNRAED